MIIATGRAVPQARRSTNLAQFEGVGVYYGATFIEAQLCGGEEVIVVGGGNSAGQAAVFLAQTARRVHMLVRGDGLADTMSRYLIRRIEENPKIIVTHATPRSRRSKAAIISSACAGGIDATGETEDARHPPRLHDDRRDAAHGLARWLRRARRARVRQDRTRSDRRRPRERARGRSPGAPYLLETSLPGVFAVGDVRGGNVKRVASAVGEGSVVRQLVHRVLAE